MNIFTKYTFYWCVLPFFGYEEMLCKSECPLKFHPRPPESPQKCDKSYKGNKSPLLYAQVQ